MVSIEGENVSDVAKTIDESSSALYHLAANKSIRRNRPGTSSNNWCNWADQNFEDMESTLAVQQYIQQLIRKEKKDIDLILQSPDQQDEGVWKYEQLRQFCMELNSITVKLQNVCNLNTCTQMTATEQWIFLCAAHKNPKECNAIDYTRHTLDGAACLLNSSRYFPSRVNIKESSVQKLGSICRRIYRIFSHAYFHHKEVFDEFEKETSLCHRFTKFVLKYDLMTSDTLIVPILDAPSQPTAPPPPLSSPPSVSASVVSSSSSSSPPLLLPPPPPQTPTPLVSNIINTNLSPTISSTTTTTAATINSSNSDNNITIVDSSDTANDKKRESEA